MSSSLVVLSLEAEPIEFPPGLPTTVKVRNIAFEVTRNLFESIFTIPGGPRLLEIVL
jgi:hypothetical protein